VIEVEGLAVRAGAFALDGISFRVPAGGYAVLMGKTGSGKTSILEAICGLRPIAAGRVRLGEFDVTDLAPGDRGVGYVPQDRALFRTMSVRENLAFSPRVRGWEPAAIEERVHEMGRLLGIEDLLGRKPAGLSGGEAQRVALGRALAARPSVLCMDEPLTALDDETREEMIGLLHSVRKATGATVLHITHSREEARRLADRLFVLEAGIVREATSAELEKLGCE
jgi:ABC-type sugar transport system ATPase subunit